MNINGKPTTPLYEKENPRGKKKCRDALKKTVFEIFA